MTGIFNSIRIIPLYTRMIQHQLPMCFAINIYGIPTNNKIAVPIYNSFQITIIGDVFKEMHFLEPLCIGIFPEPIIFHL